MWGMLRATHLEPTLAVTAIACALAWSAGRTPAGVAWVGAAVLAGQASVGWSNDWVDRERDRAARRRDKPIVAGAVSDRVVLVGAAVAVVAAVPLSLVAAGRQGTLVHLIAIASAWAYNLWLKFTPASPLPYALSFALLPVFVALGAGGGMPPGWVLATGALLGAGAHFTQSLPDLEQDAALGVRGLPHRLGPLGCVLAAAALFLLGAGVAVLGPPRTPAPTALAAGALTVLLVAGIVVAGMGGRRRLAFRLTILAALSVVAAFVAGAPLAS